MPRAFSEQEKQVIAERLREQGRKHFAMYGLRKTRVEELAAAAGISKGAFYLFYESKEALFMDVVEQAEADFRQQVLAAIDLPGPSPRARLFAVLHRAFTLWKTIPLLQLFTHGDYEWLTHRIPAQKLEAHLLSDRGFIEELIARCQAAGIPIKADAQTIDELLHALFFTSLHEDDFGAGTLSGAITVMLKLIVAYCLGEVEIEAGDAPTAQSQQLHEQNHALRN